MGARGRPRSFDRDAALHRAMEVFWDKGYEGAQLTDLTAAMSINPPSFYAAFGTKEAAFREAVELYMATVGADRLHALDESRTAADGVRAILESTVEFAVGAPGRPGCMIVLGIVNYSAVSEPLHELLVGLRRQGTDRMRERLQRGVREGDLPAGTDVARLAHFYSAMLSAISFQARDGATRKELLGLVESAMTALS